LTRVNKKKNQQAEGVLNSSLGLGCLRKINALTFQWRLEQSDHETCVGHSPAWLIFHVLFHKHLAHSLARAHTQKKEKKIENPESKREIN
jgi:hypothetical protein